MADEGVSSEDQSKRGDGSPGGSSLENAISAHKRELSAARNHQYQLKRPMLLSHDFGANIQHLHDEAIWKSVESGDRL